MRPQKTTADPSAPVQLTQQDFAEVLEVLKGMGESAGSERRQTTRVSIQTPVYIAPVVAGRPGPVKNILTRDISLMGMGLMQATPVVEGETFIVKLPKSSKKPLFVVIKPVQCRLMAESLYAIGAQFVATVNLSPEDAARFERPSQMDRIRQGVLT